MVSVVKSYKE